MPLAARCPTMISIMRNKIVKIAVAAFWLGLWQLLAMCVSRDFILASPIQVFRRLVDLIATDDFWRTLLRSALHILSGFAIGLVIGVVTAACSSRFRVCRTLLTPLYAVIRAIPVASYVILALFWLPSRSLSVLIAALVVFPLIYTFALAEIGRVDPKMLEMARLFRLPMCKKALYCYLMPSLDSFATTCATAIGMAFKSGVAAELICMPSGTIGDQLYRAKVYLMSGDLLAWTIAVILLSAACSRLLADALQLLKRKLEGGRTRGPGV